jgi:UDP-N-acetylglucosamine 2-epimerase (non-hydrolysing)
VRRIMVVYGTRPEAIKIAPLVMSLASSEHFEPVVVVTAQHRELLDQVNGIFGIEPDHDLGVLRPGQTLTEITTKAAAGLDELLTKLQPDAVVVQGDTTTTLVGALTSFYRRIPVVHLEAGLRTGDRTSPFPEEINRRITTQLADLHLAPTHSSRDNLVAEDVPAKDIVVTGNTVIDALLQASLADGTFEEPRLRSLPDDRPVLVVTAHRRESWNGGIEAIGRALSRLADQERSLHIVFPVHPNPVVRGAVLPHLADRHNVVVTEPLAYGDFARLLRRAHVVLTDSGGIQEEAPSLGTPVLVTRDTTERPEAIEAGTADLVGTDEGRIVTAVQTLVRSPEAHRRMANAVNPYGDGRAAERAVAALAHLFGLGPRPEPFRPEPPKRRHNGWLELQLALEGVR